MIQYTHPDRAANCIQQQHNNDMLDEVTYHLYKSQNIGMPIEKEQQMMLGHLQAKKMNGNALEEIFHNIKQPDRPSDSSKRKNVSTGKQKR